MKGLIGKTEVEDGFRQLDMLTKEENLMTAARTLRVASDIRHDAEAIREDTRNIKDDTRDIKDDVHILSEIHKRGAPHFFNVFRLVSISSYHMLIIAIDELQRLLLS